MGTFFAIDLRRLLRAGGVLMVGAAACVLFALGGTAQARGPVNHCVKSAHPHKHRVIRVGTFEGKKGQCKGIQEAINIAEPGNWILIAPGDYKQASIQKIEGATGSDDIAGGDIIVRTPDLHIRGMNRNEVMIDGTKPGFPECSNAEAAQNFGEPEGEGYRGNNGIIVYEVESVWLQNFSACNFLGSNQGGDEIWFDGDQSSGKQKMRTWWGEYLSATSTYWDGVSKPNATYGVYSDNVYEGPGVFNHTYASNMSDSGVYIGACPNCGTIVENSKYEGNDLGYSGSNSGGHLIIENDEFNNNEEGVATTSQNNDDAPSPQDGICPEGKENPSPPAGAQRKNICWEMIKNRIIENNNGGTPTNSGAPGLLGTGMTLAGRNDLVAENLFKGNGAWGVVITSYPGLEEEPPAQVLEAFPEDNCRGGTKVSAGGKNECLYEPWANEIEGNTFADNGGFKNVANADMAEVSSAEPKELVDCWHGNVEEGGGEPSSEPKAIQTTKGTCSDPDVVAGEPATSPLGVAELCDSRLVAECPSGPGYEYPRTEVKLLSVKRMEEESPTMPNPCEGVPSDPWCKKGHPIGARSARARSRASRHGRGRASNHRKR